ncbi:solute carrier family 43 member 3 [Lingula anatina]|uniref:Solute carrier family 43 member 3 n=1 Tax=Lingula anatina TaxID=7574 RepID=A0A1S3J502_LINAN|nr:solute carrier family 43 member 3 [Lingula anatina]|eukprot:XP_013404919.1 solute carrier family 43 member 3 [Lingula anatina]
MERMPERLYKTLTVTLVLLEGTLYCGSLQGWPALVYIFKDSHLYSHLCSNSTAAVISRYNRSYGEDFDVRISHECPEQEEMLNLVFTVAIFMQVLMPLLGYIYDHCGTACVRAVSIAFSAGGLILMALSRPGLEWVLFPGASCHFVGGAMLLSTDMTMPLLFPTRKSTLRSLLNGVANMSAFSLLLVKLAYDNGIAYRWSLIFFAALTCLIAVPTTLILPPRHYVHSGSDVTFDDSDVKQNGGHDKKDSDNKWDFCLSSSSFCRCLSTETVGRGTEKKFGKGEGDRSRDLKAIEGLLTEKRSSENTNGGHTDWKEKDMEEKMTFVGNSKSNKTTMSFVSILKQPMFWWSELWFAGNLLLVMMYFGSFNSVVDYRSNQNIEQVSLYTNAVGYVQVAISIPSAALVGYLVDRQQEVGDGRADPKTFVPSFLITSVSGLLVWILCAIPNLEIQFAAMMLHCVLRSSAFGVFTAFIAYAFPIKHFGKAYTVQRALMALFCGLQFPLFYWLKNDLESDPLYFSLVMIGISCLTFSLPAYVVWRKNNVNTEMDSHSQKLKAMGLDVVK